MTRLRSLQAQLVLRLTAVFVLATTLAVLAVIYEGTHAAKTWGDDELEERAVKLARSVTRDPDGRWHLNLPASEQQLYDAAARTRLLAVRAPDGTVVAASDPGFAAEVAQWPTAGSERRTFRVRGFGRPRPV